MKLWKKILIITAIISGFWFLYTSRDENQKTFGQFWSQFLSAPKSIWQNIPLPEYLQPNSNQEKLDQGKNSNQNKNSIHNITEQDPKNAQASIDNTTNLNLPEVLGATTNFVAGNVENIGNTGQQTAQHIRGILKTEIKGNFEPRLHERAFDYARYQYCLQVVKEFEQREDNQ